MSIKQQITYRPWTGRPPLEIKLDASFESESLGVRLGAAVKIAFSRGADLSRAVLSGAVLSRADLSRAILSGADLSRAVLSRAVLSGADLIGADLSGAILSGAVLSRADLSRAILSGADLSGAVLSRAVLSRAVLSGADLSGADLSGAVLSGAVLSGADLSGADLSRADLIGADLIGAVLSDDIKLVGRRPYLAIGPLGSRCDTLHAWLTDKGAYIKAGCFFDTLAAFREAVAATHGANEHAHEYAAAIALIEAHAAIYLPAPEEAAA